MAKMNRKLASGTRAVQKGGGHCNALLIQQGLRLGHKLTSPGSCSAHRHVFMCSNSKLHTEQRLNIWQTLTASVDNTW